MCIGRVYQQDSEAQHHKEMPYCRCPGIRSYEDRSRQEQRWRES